MNALFAPVAIGPRVRRRTADSAGDPYDGSTGGRDEPPPTGESAMSVRNAFFAVVATVTSALVLIPSLTPAIAG
ncbi:hypothetical protein GCM10010994_34160 [Chelatococcus reniformis]|uniref:Uncharacterized protein n=1 Tax=Chelatococcus reniformis TaxID=1494448 RepID=A0A916UH89_9HYPH|nr:hypothetical protein GCM10010994_34160 [Chelatococcus reniformis]